MSKGAAAKRRGAGQEPNKATRSRVWPHPEIRDDLAGHVFELLRTEQAKWGWPAHFAKLSPADMHEWEMRQYAQPFARACRRLAGVLDAAQRDSTIAASEDVKDFAFMMQQVIEASALSDIEHAYKLLARAVTFRADLVRRASGERVRTLAEDAWDRDVKAGKPERGRLKRVQAELAGLAADSDGGPIPATTVRDALVAAGRITPRKKISG